MKARRGFALSLVLLIAGGACGKGSAQDDAAAKPGQAVPAPVNGRSSIYGVEIPAGAKLDESMSKPGYELYRLTPNPQIPLVQTYEEKMPKGVPFNGLDWCTSRQYGFPVYESSWQKPGTEDFLVVKIVVHTQDTTFTIVDDKANAARTCEPSSDG
jgi:hypothetical protein